MAQCIRGAQITLAALCMFVWTTFVFAIPSSSGTESPAGGLMGGSVSDANAVFLSTFDAGATTAASTYGEIAANDPTLTQSIAGGAFDFNQFTGRIDGCDNARWTATFFSRMILKTDAFAPAGFSNNVKARSRAELTMWGNLNADGWSAREIQNTNMQSAGAYDIFVMVEGRSRKISQGGLADVIGVYKGPSVALTDGVLISWGRYRDSHDVQFTYQSLSSGELVLEFTDADNAQGLCQSRHTETTDGMHLTPFQHWEIEVFAWDMDIPGGAIIDQYSLE